MVTASCLVGELGFSIGAAVFGFWSDQLLLVDTALGLELKLHGADAHCVGCAQLPEQLAQLAAGGGRAACLRSPYDAWLDCKTIIAATKHGWGFVGSFCSEILGRVPQVLARHSVGRKAILVRSMSLKNYVFQIIPRMVQVSGNR